MKSDELELIMAYFDGELGAEQRVEAEALLRRKREARDWLDKLERSDRFLRQGLSEVLAQPVPDRLVEAVARAPEASNHVGRFSWLRAFSHWPLATAAGLLLVIAIGLLIFLPFDHESGRIDTLVASVLNEALESTPSGALYRSEEGAVQVMPVATFTIDRGGWGICREYAGRYQAGQVFGLACRDSGGDWSVVVEQESAAPSPGAGPDQYLPATGSEDRVAQTLEELGAGRPLSPEREARLIENQWR